MYGHGQVYVTAAATAQVHISICMTPPNSAVPNDAAPSTNHPLPHTLNVCVCVSLYSTFSESISFPNKPAALIGGMSKSDLFTQALE